MSRRSDLDWFERNRAELAGRYSGRWLVVLDGSVVADFATAAEATAQSVADYGVARASVFQAVAQDPVLYFGP